MCSSAGSSPWRRSSSCSISCVRRPTTTSRHECDWSACTDTSSELAAEALEDIYPSAAPADRRAVAYALLCLGDANNSFRAAGFPGSYDEAARAAAEVLLSGRWTPLDRMARHDTTNGGIPYAATHGASHVGWRRSRLPPRSGRVPSRGRVRDRHGWQRAVRDPRRRPSSWSALPTSWSVGPSSSSWPRRPRGHTPPQWPWPAITPRW